MAFPISHCHWTVFVDPHIHGRSAGGFNHVGSTVPGQEPFIPVQRSNGGAHQHSLLESPLG